MSIDIQFKLKSNPNYIKYLRENSRWYKILLRDPNSFNDFADEVKVNYHLRPIDKINQVFKFFELYNTLMGPK